MRLAARVLVITDPCGAVLDTTRAALSAARPGEAALIVRDKGAGARELAALGRALLPLARAAGAPLLVNDRCDVARAIGADGAHLPERGLRVADARAVLGPGALVGVSRHGPPREDEREDPPDYVTLGPVGPVEGKGSPLGLDGFAEAARAWPVPVYALGGVGVADVPELVARGAAGVAVIRAVYAAADPAAALRALLDSRPRSA
ncbi:MAG: thiamine phosphate synthase [Sandaracinaceae bacterium]|nr:thiamine phosphate synthase [Sandaracinaceae bacterium]